ncbi:hypothetical protein HDU92_000396 [Lobulomyces angularis]|nr:hypothetical protein HDU92_000396 [Lobulomyces angularis]
MLKNQILKKYNILFFGSDEFSIITLKRLLNSDIVQNLQVVTTKSVPLFNFSKTFLNLHIPPQHTLKSWEAPKLNGQDFDLAVVVSFGYFLPPNLINKFSVGALNVHPSLLPKYRGAAPIQHQILNDEKISGVSIIELDKKKFDAGKILKQSSLKVCNFPFYKVLHDELAMLGGNDLVETIKNIDSFKKQAIVQDESLVTQAPKILKEMGRIDFNCMNNYEIFKLHRAIGFKIPLYAQFRKKRIQLFDLKLATLNFSTMDNFSAGSLLFDKQQKKLFVKCFHGWLEILKLKVQDKKLLSADDFHNGYTITESDHLKSCDN